MAAPPEPDGIKHSAVFLDLDGTLLEIAEHPDLVHVPPGLLTALESAHDRLTGALAMISGRPIADLDTLLAPLRLPAAGIHGIEYRDTPDELHTIHSENIPQKIRHRVTTLVDTHPGLLLEDKGNSLAVHFRQAPDKENLVRTELQAVSSQLDGDFVLQNGKMVMELRPAGANKGTAVSRFMTQPAFAGRQPVFIGDDITDEDAFQVVNQMQGLSIRVGPKSEDSVAQYELQDVAAVHEWLSLI